VPGAPLGMTTRAGLPRQPPAPLVSPSGASSQAGVGAPSSPALAGDVGADLVVVLRAPLATLAAGRPAPTTLTCESLSGTTLAVLEVDADSERVAGLQERLEDRLSAMLAKSGAWSQRVRLTLPDGTTLLEPSDLEQSVRQLLAGPRWREAEASWEAHGGLEVAQTPSAASRHHSRSRRSTGAQELERKLGKLQEAKHLPLNGTHSRRSPSGAADTMDRMQGSAPAEAASGPVAVEEKLAGEAGASASQPPLGVCDRVLMASSLDKEHPPDNVIDGSDATYWISTGMYPQMILLELGQPTRISTVRLATTDVRGVHVEGCSGPAATSFETLGSAELDLARGDCRLQMKELRCQALSQPTRFVKTTILSGWNDFCSVHRIVVE